MLPEENNRPSPAMDEIYKDFAIIHADSERALSLLRGLDEKLKRAIATTTPKEGNGDRWYQFYGLRMNCLDCTAALLRGFDSDFAQSILLAADVAIADELEAEESIQEANEVAYEKEKAIADEAEGDEVAIADEDEEAIADEDEVAIADEDEEEETEEERIECLLVILAKALGVQTNQATISQEGIVDSLIDLVRVAQRKDAREQYWRLQQDKTIRKIQYLAIPLLEMYFDADFPSADDSELAENREVLLRSAQEILEISFKNLRDGYNQTSTGYN